MIPATFDQGIHPANRRRPRPSARRASVDDVPGPRDQVEVGELGDELVQGQRPRVGGHDAGTLPGQTQGAVARPMPGTGAGHDRGPAGEAAGSERRLGRAPGAGLGGDLAGAGHGGRLPCPGVEADAANYNTALIRRPAPPGAGSPENEHAIAAPSPLPPSELTSSKAPSPVGQVLQQHPPGIGRLVCEPRPCGRRRARARPGRRPALKRRSHRADSRRLTRQVPPLHFLHDRDGNCALQHRRAHQRRRRRRDEPRPPRRRAHRAASRHRRVRGRTRATGGWSRAATRSAGWSPTTSAASCSAAAR